MASGTVVNGHSTDRGHEAGQAVSGTGVAIGTIVNSDGFIGAIAGGTISGAIVNSGFLDINSGGSAVGTILFNGGRQQVEVGATASGTTIHAGGRQVVFGTADQLGDRRRRIAHLHRRFSHRRNQLRGGRRSPGDSERQRIHERDQRV